MTDTKLERYSKVATTRLARSVSRRSFIGRVGRGAIAASLGSAGAALLANNSALAHTGGCGCADGCGLSVSCDNLPGHMHNSCPSGSCGCGCWCCSTTGCASGYREWCDCCGGCSGGAGCANGKPTCYNHAVWSNGCNGHIHIKCRRKNCVPRSSCGAIDPSDCA